MRAIASLSLSLGLVSIPVKLYSASERAADVRFKWMSAGGARLRQRYVADAAPADAEPEADTPARHDPGVEPQESDSTALDAHQQSGGSEPRAVTPPTSRATRIGEIVDRHEMAKGYEYEEGRFVLFSPAELRALEAQARETIDIVAFVPASSVDPIYYERSYLVAPGHRGERTYSLLHAALTRGATSAVAKWIWKGKQRIVQIRPADGGLVLHQLFYADEIRTPRVLGIDLMPVGETELNLALQLIDQQRQPSYDPTQFVDEVKRRLLEAIDRKIAGRQIVVHDSPSPPPAATADVVDLLQALRDSLHGASKGRHLSARKPVARAKPASGAARSDGTASGALPKVAKRSKS